MKISQWQFENELEGLINAALNASCKETARDWLRKAENKINGYDNIPYDLQRKYRDKIESARCRIGL